VLGRTERIVLYERSYNRENAPLRYQELTNRACMGRGPDRPTGRGPQDLAGYTSRVTTLVTTSAAAQIRFRLIQALRRIARLNLR
jgi:hypothetical protein